MNIENGRVTYNSRNLHSTKAFAQYWANKKKAGVNLYSHTWSYDGETFTDYVTSDQKKRGNEYTFVCYVRPQPDLDKCQDLRQTLHDASYRGQW